MAKFRRKPVVVDAEQFHPDQKPWPVGVMERTSSGRSDFTPKERTFGFNGVNYGAKIRPGDWVVTNQTGERYIVLQDHFFDVFEPVP